MTTRAAITLTHAQRALARHALGLPNARQRSYRNTYVAAYCPGSYDDWLRMVDSGAALASPRIIAKTRRFWLTVDGANAALDSGESLDPEDFPL